MYQIPTLQELYAEDGSAFMNDKFQQMLNQDPIAHWVKVEKNIPYLPIDKVEILLDRIFVGMVQVEIKEVKIVLNSIQATVRLLVFHPIKQMWVFNDGVGAMPIQLAKGATPGDLSKVNHAAIQMNAPAAVSFAVKDAAERFGKIFGRDLSRKDTVNYQPAFISDPFVEGSAQATQLGGGLQQIGAYVGAVQPPPPPTPPGQYQQWQQPAMQTVPQGNGSYFNTSPVPANEGQPTPPIPGNGSFNNNFFNDPNQSLVF